MRCLDGDTEGLCQRHTVQYLLLQFQSSITPFVKTSVNKFVVKQNKHNKDCHSCATFLPGHKVSNCQICHRKYILRRLYISTENASCRTTIVILLILCHLFPNTARASSITNDRVSPTLLKNTLLQSSIYG